MRRRVYDQERDGQPLSFEAGMPVHLGRLSAALTCLLEAPDNPVTQALSRAALQAFEDWYEQTRPPRVGSPEFVERVLAQAEALRAGGVS